MAATTYGTNIHLWGINGTYTAATIASQNIDSEPANKADVVDENGNVVENRYDDVTTTGSFKLITRSGTTLPTAGGIVTVPDTGVASACEGVGKEQEARGHRMATIKFRKCPGITYT